MFASGDVAPTQPELNLAHIPVVTPEWAFDSHAQYTVCDYADYLWKNGIFTNLTFFLNDFKRDAATVQRHIEANDGRVVAELAAATYVVCPRTVTTDIYKDERAVSARWLRACLEKQRLLPRTDNALFRPYPALLAGRLLCLTGFGRDDFAKMEAYVA